MANVEKLADMAMDSAESHDDLVVESKTLEESAEITDKTGVLRNEAKLVIRTAGGTISEMLKNKQYLDRVRTKLRAGGRVTFNAKDAVLSAEDVQAIHDEAVLNAKEGKGTIQIADVHSSQMEDLTKKLGHMGVSIVSHERTYNVMSAARDEAKVAPAKKQEEEVAEESYEGMQA